VLLFSLGLSLVTGVVFGLAPALRASHPGLVPALKDESFVPDERSRRFNLKKGLIVAEVALSLMLLVIAGLFLRSLRATQSVDTGVDVERLTTAPLNINLLRYTRDQGRQFYGRVIEQMEAIPGVESASVARIAPIAGAGRVVSLQIEGRENTDTQLRSEGGGMRGNGRDTVATNVVGPKYFATLGVALKDGRDFGSADSAASPPVAIVTEAFRRRHLPTGSAVGRRISVSGPRGPWCEIVGVVADSTYATVGETPTPVVYVPIAQNHETGVTLVVRSAVDPETIATAIRKQIQAIEPNLPMPAIRPMRATIATSLYAARMGATLLSVFGGVALLLAAIGIYGVMAFLVSHRTREFGIRLALGADARDLFGLVLKEGMVLVLAGIVLGLGGAAAGGGLVRAFLFGVSTTDVVTFVAVPLLLAAVALAACVVPAWRAMKVEPTEALKYT
jgi:predicted permease